MKNQAAQDKVRNNNPDWQFPDFEVQEFAKKASKYCVCVFVINEGERIQKQLERMKQYTNQIDVVVADGGSTDGSLEPDFLGSVKVRALLTKKGPGKLSAQMRMAMAWALDEGYEGVVVVDGNGKDDISALPDFVKLLDEGYDHVQGSRFIPGGKAINTPLSRELGLHLLHAPLISLASRKRHTDTTNGFRGYSAKLLRDQDIAVFRDVFKTYELHYYLAIESSRRKQYKTTETPVTREYPKTGKTPTKISPVKGNIHILKVLFSAAAGKYKPSKRS
jgi:glycosyltransferase involved in cell wall biosynthesis